MNFLATSLLLCNQKNRMKLLACFLTGFLLLSNKTALAGDYLPPRHYVIIASIKAPKEASQTGQYGGNKFVANIAELESQYRAKCGDVRVWHTDLMDDEQVTWTPSYWFVFAGPGESLDEAKAIKQQNPCAAKGYIKRGSMVIPTRYYVCSDPKFMPNADRKAMCQGW